MTCTYFGIFLIVVLLGSDPPANQVLPHRVGKSKVVIPSGRHIPVLDQRKVEMSVEILLQRWDVFNAGEASHWNLFPSIMVRQGFRHGGTRWSGSGLRLWQSVNSKTAGTHTHTTRPRYKAREVPTPHRLRFSVLKARLWILSRGWSRLCIWGKGWYILYVQGRGCIFSVT